MGRPPLGMKPTTIRLPLETMRRIEMLVGKKRIAKFIREAIESELERREKAEPPTELMAKFIRETVESELQRREKAKSPTE